jgi:hypothetical protein
MEKRRAKQIWAWSCVATPASGHTCKHGFSRGNGALSVSHSVTYPWALPPIRQRWCARDIPGTVPSGAGLSYRMMLSRPHTHRTRTHVC